MGDLEPTDTRGPDVDLRWTTGNPPAPTLLYSLAPAGPASGKGPWARQGPIPLPAMRP